MDRSYIFEQINDERARQNQKWGVQNHPFTDPGAEYHLPTENKAKAMCDGSAKLGKCTWTHIILEEFVEAVNAKDNAHLRAELVQLAAVVVSSIENLDRGK